MSDLEMKKRVAQEIMDLMDQKDGDRLKKHPKLQAAKLEEESPEPEDVEKPEGAPELESESEEEEEEELSPEIIQKLLEMVSGK